MKTYNLAKEIGIINLPKKVVKGSLMISDNKIWYRYYDDAGVRQFTSVELPCSGYSILSIAKEMTEELAAQIMEKVTVNQWKNYLDPSQYMDRAFETDLESFHSFMHSIGMPCVNPLSFDPTGVTTREWQEAEAKLVNSLILVKEE